MSKTATGSLETLRPNPDWAKLPLFNRKGWKRLRVEPKGVTRAAFGWQPAGKANIQ